MTCLSRVLTSQQKDDLDNPADWICMCCTAKISSEPPPLSSSQWRIVTPIFKSKGIEDTSGVGKNQITDKCSTLSLDYPSPLSMPGMLLKDNTNRIKTEQILGSECTVQISLNRTFQGEKVKKMINEDKAGTLVSLSRIKCSAEVKSNNGKANITASKSSKNKLCLKLSASAVTSVKRSAGDFVNANAGKINRSESLNLAVKPPSGVLPVRDHKAKKMDQCAVPEVLVRACAPGVQSEDKLIESEGHPPVRVNALTNVTHSEPVLLPLSSTVDEVFYFSQYIEVRIISSMLLNTFKF